MGTIFIKIIESEREIDAVHCVARLEKGRDIASVVHQSASLHFIRKDA